MAFDTPDSSPIHHRLLTHRRPAVVRWRNHHANTYFSAIPLGFSTNRWPSKTRATNPCATSRSASNSPCARLVGKLRVP